MNTHSSKGAIKTTRGLNQGGKHNLMASPKARSSGQGQAHGSSGQKSQERIGTAQGGGRAEAGNVKTQRSYRGMTNSNPQSNAATGVQRVPVNAQPRSPFNNSQAELPRSIQQRETAESNGNITPTQDSRQFQQVNFSSKNFSLRQSNDSVTSQNMKSNPSSKTQKLMQKSMERKEGRKNVEGVSRERLLWTGQTNPNQAYNDTNGKSQPFQAAMLGEQPHQSSSRTQRQENQRQQQFRMSTESHVSGISGILGTTQLTAGASQISIGPHNGQQRSQNTGSDRLSDEILIGCTVLQQPKQGHQHLMRSIEPNSGYNDKGYNQTLTIVQQPSQNTNDSFQQTYENTAKHQNLLNSASQLNNQSTFSTQLQLITSNLQNKVCNSIEEAQPILRLCLTNVGLNSVSASLQASQFTSILSENEIDQNLVCPMCKFLVVNPVECSSCQYIICYKCADQCHMRCFDKSCQQPFTSQPGKIHKLYRAMLNQLEFRCPNQGAGCQTLLKYDCLDHHLKNLCESRDKQCPNRCSKQKFSVNALKDHIENSCPKEKFSCPECGDNLMRIDMQQHLEHACEQVKIKCEKCDQVDTRGSFQNNKHDCISLLKDAIQQIQSTTDRDSTGAKSTRRLRSGDQRPRALDDYTKNQKSIGQPEVDLIMKQVNNLKKGMQNLDTIVTEDIFKMFDNMSLCVTQKDNEVKELTEKVKKLEEGAACLQTNITKQTKDYEGLLYALDLKLEEQVKEIKESQEREISKLKMMVLNQLESDMPLQIKSQAQNRSNAEERKIEYVPIRGRKKHSVVPPINFGSCEGMKQVQVQDIEQANQQINGPGSSQTNAQVPPPLSSKRSKKSYIGQSKDNNAAYQQNMTGLRELLASDQQLQQRHSEIEEIDEENDDFVPFLSSTNDEFTDLNTDFNTDRVGESSGPQSTYRQMNTKRSSHQERQPAPAQRQPHQHQNSHQQLTQMPQLQPLHTQASQTSLLQAQKSSSTQQLLSHQEPREQQPIFAYPDDPSEHRNKEQVLNINHENNQKQKQDESCLNDEEEDMSFDNESVQHDENQEASDLERNQQKVNEQHNDDAQHSDGSDRSFNNNDEVEEHANDGEEIQDRVQQEHMLIRDSNAAVCSSFDQNLQKGSIQILDSQPMDRRSKLGQEQNDMRKSKRQQNESAQLVSILDESSDIEQLQNDQLPGSIHGGFSHHHSILSQGQFSALSRGQLFNNGGGPAAQASCADMSAFSIPNGLSSERQMHMESIDSRAGPIEGMNHDHIHSLESLDSFQVNLDKNPSAGPTGSNKYKQAKPNQNSQKEAQLEQERQDYQKKLISALDRNDSNRHDLEKNGEELQTSDEEIFSGQADIDRNQKDTQNLQNLIMARNQTQSEQYNLNDNIRRFQQEQQQSKHQEEYEEYENEQLISNLKNEAQNMIDAIVEADKEKQQDKNKVDAGEANEADNEEEYQLGSGSEEDPYQNDYMDHQDQQIMLLEQQLMADQTQSDLEGNETENEVIRDHLDQLREVGNQGGGISALKGLESDLETIFETDLESNYVTTARTNLSTKKLLHQINHLQLQQNHMPEGEDQDRLGQILMSQFSPIAHSGSNTAHNSNQKPGNSASIRDYSSMPIVRGKAGNPYKLNTRQQSGELEEPSPGAGNVTDSSQSMLISNRSTQAQQVRNNQMPANMISPQTNQCFFTHQELEQLGKQNPQLSQGGQQSQLDLDERRIRVYTGSTESKRAGDSEEKPSQSSRTDRSGDPKQKQRSSRKGTNNNYQDIIKEEEVEDEPQDFYLQNEGTTVEKLQNIRQNLKDKFDNYK